MKAFLICPVRQASEEMTDIVFDAVCSLEEAGNKVHWPARDTDQNDDTGFRICTDNKKAIEGADEVAIVWDGKSQGCLFDIGMAFAMNKKIKIIHLPEYTEEKSFQNMIRNWEETQYVL